MALRDNLPPEVVAAARQRYTLARAAELIDRHILPVAEGDPRIGDGRVIARALANAGLLISPKHDAAVRAEALRDAARDVGSDPYRNELANPKGWLNARADAIEKEAGETDEDT